MMDDECAGASGVGGEADAPGGAEGVHRAERGERGGVRRLGAFGETGGDGARGGAELVLVAVAVEGEAEVLGLPAAERDDAEALAADELRHLDRARRPDDPRARAALNLRFGSDDTSSILFYTIQP